MIAIQQASFRPAETHLAVVLLGHDSTDLRRAIPASLDGGRVLSEQVEHFSAPQSGESLERVNLLLALPERVDVLTLADRLEALGNVFGCDTDVAV